MSIKDRHGRFQQRQKFIEDEELPPFAGVERTKA